jgi:UDP-N-acetyl-D-mannosaminuronic acid dehydrogenase
MIGLGYIGLPTAAVIASNKIEVIGVDLSQNVVNTINEGRIHIVEPTLDGLVKKVVDEGYLRASDKYKPKFPSGV